MNVALQKHGAKHIYRIPEGLRELCADISREVLRAQPSDIYCFVADYIDALLITRENAKVAVKVVNNILLQSQSIIDILRQSGLSLEQIAIASTRLHKAFRSYLDFVDVQRSETQEEEQIEENSRICIRHILETTGTSWEQADVAATTIQTAFRSHYKEMLVREARGEVQWQRAVINTIAILRKAGVSQEEAAKAVTLIQSSYRGYYTRRNIKLKILSNTEEDGRMKNDDILEPRETIQAVAWMDMMFEDSKHTVERASEAATVIQSAYRGFRTRVSQGSNEYTISRSESSQSMVVKAILDNLHQRIWDKLKSVEQFPEEIGSRKEMEATIDQIQTEYKNKQRTIRISGQLEEDMVQETQSSITEQNVEVETAVDPGVSINADEERAQSGAGVVQDLKTADEIDLKADERDDLMIVAESETQNETEEHKGHDEAESVLMQEAETKLEEHKEHEEKESDNEADV